MCLLIDIKRQFVWNLLLYRRLDDPDWICYLSILRQIIWKWSRWLYTILGISYIAGEYYSLLVVIAKFFKIGLQPPLTSI